MSDQIESIGPVELPKDEQVRKAIDVVQPGLELAQELDDAFCIVLGAKTFGNRRGLTVRAMNEADRLGGKHDQTPPPFILCAAEPVPLAEVETAWDRVEKGRRIVFAV
jgi:hypothetical protein